MARGSGLSIHVGSTALGLGFVGELVKPAFESGGSWWEKVSAIGTALVNDEAHQRNLALLGAAYVGVRAARGSIEKKPLIEVGKVRIYAL